MSPYFPVFRGIPGLKGETWGNRLLGRVQGWGGWRGGVRGLPGLKRETWGNRTIAAGSLLPGGLGQPPYN